MAKQAEQQPAPVAQSLQNAVPDASGKLRIFKLYRKSKKTPQNPEGWQLMQLTYAPSEEAATAMAVKVYEAQFGQQIRIEEVPS